MLEGWGEITTWLGGDSERMARIDISPNDNSEGGLAIRVRLFEFGMSGPPSDDPMDEVSYSNYEHIGHGNDLISAATRALRQAEDHRAEIVERLS